MGRGTYQRCQSKQVIRLLGLFGIKISARRNLPNADIKERTTIHQLFSLCCEKNLKKHVAACTKVPDYKPIEFNYNGNKFIATPGQVAGDGAGKKRAFNHLITGTKTGFVMQSGEVNAPSTFVHSQNNCIN